MMKNKNRKSLFFILGLFIVFIINLILIVSIHFSWNNSMKKHYDISRHVKVLRNNISTAYQLLGEAINGNSYVIVEDDVMKPLKHIYFTSYVKRIEKTLNSSKYKEILVSLKQIDNKLDNFYNLSKQRWGQAQKYKIEKGMDRYYNSEYKEVKLLIEKIFNQIEQSLGHELKSENIFFKWNVIVFLIINIFAFSLLFIINKRKEQYEVNLSLTNKELAKHQDHLEELVKSKTMKLEKSLIELKNTQKSMIESEKMAALGGLVAGVAHEINTPIGLGVTSMSHFILETEKINKFYHDDNLSQESFEKYLKDSLQLADITYTNLKRAAELVRSFKQISVDQTSQNLRKFNLKKYVEEILLSLRNEIKKVDIKIDINCDDNLVLYSYPGACSQIVTNLIINSLVHAYDKGDKGKIELNFVIKESMLHFTYKDDGKGISKENLGKIFNPFFTTNRKKGGSGLGLNIIYNIVCQKLGGTIECKSELLKGVEFSIKTQITTDGEK